MSSESHHIVIDARFWRRSAAGLSTYSQSLVRNLAKLDRVNRYTILITPADVAEFDVVAPNVSALVVSIAHYSLAEQIKLPRVLALLKPDLVHFLHFNHPLNYRGKFVVTMHDLTVVYFPVGRQQRNPLRRFAFLTVMKDAVRRADRVIAVSRVTRDDIVRDLGGSPATVTVIPEGISINPRRSGSVGQRALLGVTPPYLLYVSQWRPHKRIEDLVAAFERLAVDYPALSLVLAGKPNPAFPTIIQRVEHSPLRHRIVTPGFVPDALLPTLYAHAELFVFPSLYEGFGFPPLEAMACGTPVVAARASCLPEILGDAAAYFEAGNVAALASTVASLLNNNQRRAELVRKGRAQAARYDWGSVARETLAVYREVLSTA
jgi:glycosyltransferase involved in cell wall biosynthesis